MGYAVVSTGSAGKAAGVSLNIRGPFRMKQQCGIIQRQR
jgi:hypothetical protein